MGRFKFEFQRNPGNRKKTEKKLGTQKKMPKNSRNISEFKNIWKKFLSFKSREEKENLNSLNISL